MSKEKIQVPKPNPTSPASNPNIPVTRPAHSEINKGSVPKMVDPPPPPPRPQTSKE